MSLDVHGPTAAPPLDARFAHKGDEQAAGGPVPERAEMRAQRCKPRARARRRSRFRRSRRRPERFSRLRRPDRSLPMRAPRACRRASDASRQHVPICGGFAALLERRPRRAGGRSLGNGASRPASPARFVRFLRRVPAPRRRTPCARSTARRRGAVRPAPPPAFPQARSFALRARARTRRRARRARDLRPATRRASPSRRPLRPPNRPPKERLRRRPHLRRSWRIVRPLPSRGRHPPRQPPPRSPPPPPRSR